MRINDWVMCNIGRHSYRPHYRCSHAAVPYSSDGVEINRPVVVVWAHHRNWSCACCGHKVSSSKANRSILSRLEPWVTPGPFGWISAGYLHWVADARERFG